LDDVTAERGDPALSSNIHECFVCGRGMPHSLTSIRGHLNVHDLTIDLYYEQYKVEIDRDPVSLPITDRSLLGKAAANRRSSSAGLQNNLKQLDSETQKSLNTWMNRCTYACRVCNR
jgi:hypothetical protein